MDLDKSAKASTRENNQPLNNKLTPFDSSKQPWTRSNTGTQSKKIPPLLLNNIKFDLFV